MANSELSDLFTSLQMFKEGTNELATSVALNRSAQRLKEIKEGFDKETGEHLTEAQQFEQMNQVGQGLATSMFMLGKPATTVQTQLESMGLSANTPEELITQGALAGGKDNKLGAYQIKLGEEAIKAREANKSELQAAKLYSQAQQREADRQAKIDAAKAKSRASIPLTDGQIKDINSLDDQIAKGKQLLNTIGASPNLVGLSMRIPGASTARSLIDPEYAAFSGQVGQWFDKYRQDVTGAGASVQELSDLKKNVPVVGDPPAVFAAKMRAVVSIGESVRARHIANYAKGRRDVSGFLDKQEDTANQEDAPQKKTVRNPYTNKIEIRYVDKNGKQFTTSKPVK